MIDYKQGYWYMKAFTHTRLNRSSDGESVAAVTAQA